VNWQINGAARVKNGDNRRKLANGEKTRSTGVPVVSFTGYPLLASLKARREEALREQREGHNLEALMFPTKTGKMFHHTSFNSKYLVRAAVRCEYADWLTRTWTETYTKVNLQTGKSWSRPGCASRWCSHGTHSVTASLGSALTSST
jgi:hypothetical protein